MSDGPDVVVEPRGVAELEGNAKTARYRIEKRFEARHVLAQKGRQLKEKRAEARPEFGGHLHERLGGLTHVL